ncbi:TRAP transporter small permease [Uliginosibacterium sediminicola]|uniref:TRAP transporter small permease protein n=1 Tax=Uliginosibacterium sediminicola TaxID=2024550 RepID=A0ABU9YW77_9RHOO
MNGTTRFTPMRHSGPLRPLALLIAAFDVAVGWALVAELVVMVSIVSIQVVLRYLFNSSIDWADELARLCFVWSIFTAIPLGLKGGAHIGIEMLVVRFPAHLRSVTARLIALLGAAMLLLVAKESAVMAWEQWDELMASMPASAAWFIVPLGVCGLHGALHLIWQALIGAQHVDPELQSELA